jgi:hypothetical protein
MNAAIGVSDSYERGQKRIRTIDTNTRCALLKERLEKKNHNSNSRTFFQERVAKVLDGQEMCADLLVSLFVSAIQCYRKSSICEPFPEEFVRDDGERNYEDIELYCNAFPSIENLKKKEFSVKFTSQRASFAFFYC